MSEGRSSRATRRASSAHVLHQLVPRADELAQLLEALEQVVRRLHDRLARRQVLPVGSTQQRIFGRQWDAVLAQRRAQALDVDLRELQLEPVRLL